LYDIFDKVISQGDGSKQARYRSVAGKGERVEVLMKEILQGILVVAKEPVIGQQLFAAMQKALQDVSRIPPSLEDEAGNSFHNYGSGPQSVHLGQGDMNVVSAF
jgi:hypothetical protein